MLYCMVTNGVHGARYFGLLINRLDKRSIRLMVMPLPTFQARKTRDRSRKSALNRLQPTIAELS